MNFSGGAALPTGRIVDKSDKIFCVEGEGTACESRQSESKLGDVFHKHFEFGTVVSVDGIDDCCGPPSFVPAAHDAP
jgi:hypothetical protein